MAYLWIAVGAGLGGVLRYWCYGAAARMGAETFPWGTLFVNVAGSAFIGFYASLTGDMGRLLVSPNTRMFVMTGLCGGFTTFSTFSLETLRLLQDREYAYASLNVAASLLLCVLGVWLGHVFGMWLNSK